MFLEISWSQLNLKKNDAIDGWSITLEKCQVELSMRNFPQLSQLIIIIYFFNHETHMCLKSNLLNQIELLNHMPCGVEFVINLDSYTFNLPCLNSSKQIIFSSRNLQNGALKNPKYLPNDYEFQKIPRKSPNLPRSWKNPCLIFPNSPWFAQKIHFKIECF